MKNAPLTDIEKLSMRLELAEGNIREIRGDVRVMRENWQEFVPNIAGRISREVLIPGIVRGLMEAMRQPNSLSLDLPDLLDVNAIIENEKRRERG